jgi:hypothetical protein
MSGPEPRLSSGRITSEGLLLLRDCPLVRVLKRIQEGVTSTGCVGIANRLSIRAGLRMLPAHNASAGSEYSKVDYAPAGTHYRIPRQKYAFCAFVN